jgi:hypothetical protein
MWNRCCALRTCLQNSALSPPDSSSELSLFTIDHTSPGTPVTPPEKLKEKIAQSSGPWSRTLLSLAAKGKEAVELTDTKARRSLRQKKIHRGYKGSPCSNMNCLGCSMVPPLCLTPLSKIWEKHFARLIPKSFPSLSLN